MSSTQIWIFGILGFIVLITLVTRVTPSRPPWPVARQDSNKLRKVVERATEGQAEISSRLHELATESTEIRDRLGSIERLLKEVE